jgi:cyclin-C
VATAIILFKRFYLKNSFCETEPLFVAAACCYVAAKAEEAPVHIKSVVSEGGSLFRRKLSTLSMYTHHLIVTWAGDQYGCKSFPLDTSKLAEMEFYLMSDLECDLTIYHPYRTLLSLCCVKEGGTSGDMQGIETEAGELGAVGEADGLSGGDGRLELEMQALQLAWFAAPIYS